ncbi:MAG: N-acetylmuramoyl-L-alanine amidase [Chloroflexi bacterium]|nr:N-acetylmuramoyl-L-alanine amidase [Chloroflexota bacterium]
MILVPAADNTHRFIQFQVHMDADATQLSALSFTFIDSTDGPTTAEMLAQQEALDAQQPPAITDSYPRPAVISRAVWCIYDTCDDTEDLVYEPATHLIVHHTVSSNDNTNWASAVRAIYLYHRDTQEWGDIGYNYLIDRSGVIYEGHMNEDYQNLDVVGIHAGAANTGSMGAALLGTFTSAEDEYDLGGGFIIATPPAAMLQALANLFAWKADQRGIDVYDAGRLPNTGWGCPTSWATGMSTAA